MLATGLIVAYGYADRGLHGLVQRRRVRELDVLHGRFERPLRLGLLGPDAAATCWFRSCCGRGACGAPGGAVRRCRWSCNVGMWLERFVIVVASLHRDLLPSAWGMFMPTLWDWAILLGSIGLFLTLLFLFVRVAAGDLDLRDARAGAPERRRRRPRHGRRDARRAWPTAESRPAGRVRRAQTPGRPRRRARGRLSPARRLHAVPGRRAGRGAAATGRTPVRCVCFGGRAGACGGYAHAVVLRRRSTIRSTSAAGRPTAGRRSSR